MQGVLERVTMKALPVVNRAADYAPVVPACCNACRTCTTTNVLGIATGGIVALAASVRRLFKR
jgi:hypothetical protein